MPAVGDVIELVHEQNYLGQEVNNVYYFQNNSGSGTLVSLATWFETNVVPKIKAIQNTDLRHENLRLRNLFNLAETYEEPLTGTGASTASTNEMPSFYAVTARFDHLQGDLRPAFKRWAGQTEQDFADALFGAAYVALVVTLCAELVQPPTTSNPGWVPVVVGRICEIPNPIPGATPSCLKYRLPANQGEMMLGTLLTAEVYAQPTTQNSRKWYT